MTRMGLCLGLKPAAIAEYKALHEAVWPEILARILASNIRNYSIFLREPENLLFAYWEYVGIDFTTDMAAMAADPATQKWWDICMPLQSPLPTRAEGEWWASMEEVFHTD
jgi:L-rhamnose mutarotase